jgi:hypothetical protein
MQTKAASIDFSSSRFSYRLQSELSPSLSRELGPAFMQERTVVRAGPEVGESNLTGPSRYPALAPEPSRCA